MQERRRSVPSTRSDRVREVVEPVVTDAGLFLEGVTVSSAGARSVVRIVVDLDEDATGSLDLDALTDISQEISTVLDEADAVSGQYTLEVTSPGTDRPLTERRHFKRARGRLVRLELVDGRTVTDRLTAVRADVLVLRGRGGEETTVALDEVRRGRVEVELNRAEDGEG